MSQLKPSFTQQILSELGKSRFTSEDFEIELPASGRVLLRITFTHKPAYILTLAEDTKEESITIEAKYGHSYGGGTSRTERVRNTVFTLKAVPGQFKLQDSEELAKLGDVLDEIPRWCENIRLDLYALAPNIDPLEQLRQNLRSNLDAIVQDSNGYFTDDELKVVDSRFDKLYEDIANLREEYSITKQQLADLQKQIAEFKDSARAYPRGIWARITTNKLVKATGQVINSTEGRTFLFKQISRAIGMSEEQ